MQKRLVILGSTGSIGTQALSVVREMQATVVALAVQRNIAELEQQIREFRPRYAAVYDEAAAAALKVRVRDCNVTVLSGMDGLCTLAALPDADTVLNAVVGMVGLLPTLAALKAGHDVALANKETLVAGGELVMETARQYGVRILPVDSEHSAIFQCLQATAAGPWTPPMPSDALGVRRLILTASGGPFFGKTAQQLQAVTKEDALRHPNWSMGPKITVDSATMMNKGLELIEAKWLFDLPQENIDIVIHRESVVHSLVEYRDCSVLAQMGVPDMRIPIQYALTYPHRIASPVQPLSLTAVGSLTFFEPDDEAFPCMSYCRKALQRGGAYPAAVNAANEQANALFREGKRRFPEIAEAVGRILEEPLPAVSSAEEILQVDAYCRELTMKR